MYRKSEFRFCKCKYCHIDYVDNIMSRQYHNKMKCLIKCKLEYARKYRVQNDRRTRIKSRHKSKYSAKRK